LEDLNLPTAREILQLPDPGVMGGAFEMSVGVLKEAAAMATNVPYLGAVTGVLLQIIKIKGV